METKTLAVKFLTLLFVLLSKDLHGQAIVETDDNEIVIVRQTIDTAYNNADSSFSTLVTEAQDKKVIVKPGDSLSKVISREYKVGLSNAQVPYDALISEIATRNNIDKLSVGTELRIPDLPPIAISKPNAANAHNEIPKISIDTRILKGTNLPNSIPISDDIQLSDFMRKGATHVTQIRSLTRKEARELKGSINVVKASLFVRLANVETKNYVNTNIFSDEEIVAIKQWFLKPPKKRPLLLILDDGWPDLKEKERSSRLIHQAVAEIREKFRMGAGREANKVSLLNRIPFRRSDDSHFEQEVGGQHAAKIQKALAPLLAFDGVEERVQVIYIPLLATQKGADETLHELLEINLIAREMGARLGDEVPTDVRKTARRLAQLIVNDLHTNPGADILKTDQAVIEAVWKFAYLYALVRKEPYFINMSWTVPNLEFEPSFSPDGYGLHIAAAGNEGDLQGTTLSQLKRQFAYRSSIPGDTLAVMNILENGEPACESSLLDLTKNIYGLSFHGAISDSECGTSFSAPRVAWLLAAHEAMSDLPSSTDEWILGLKAKVLLMRDDSAPGYKKIRLNIFKLFDYDPR